MPRLSLDEVESLAADALRRAGAEPHQSSPVALSVRRAEADGLGPVGLGYLPTYLRHLRAGRVDGRARPATTSPRAAVVTVDAGHGFAHPAFDVSLGALVVAARSHGTASLGITRSYSIGVLGHPVEDIARQGLVALAFTNSPPNMTAWGGRRKLFGTNPIAFAAPRASGPPLVVDQATTAVTKVALAARAATGAPLPDGWALDAEGRPTSDPVAGLAGSMAPAGGAKGVNMALLVELFAALVTGAVPSMAVAPYTASDAPPPGVGQFFLAVDPEAFAPGFGDRLEALARAIEGDPPARLPGDRRLDARRAAADNGVEVDASLLARIAAEATE
jgi:(2R)-3-sulfolactate dehydrogenase (NADP+)